MSIMAKLLGFMKIREGYILRTLLGQHIVMVVGSDDKMFNGQIVLNESSVFLWKLLLIPQNRKFLISSILEEYEITSDMAEDAVDLFIDRLSDLNVLEYTMK